MLCQKCHTNLATVRYAEVVDGHVTEQHLCPTCVASREKNASAGFELGGPLPSARRSSPAAAQIAAPTTEAEDRPVCSVCGASLHQLLDSGRAGCPACYPTFYDSLEPLLARLHRSRFHKGKINQLNDTRDRLRSALQAKRALLRSVLRTENYEEAARLRDEIKQLESGLYVAETGVD